MAGKFKFRASLHPRGAKGQFINTPDKIKPSTQRAKATSAFSAGLKKKQKRLAPEQVEAARTEIMSQLAKAQRERLQEVVKAKAPKAAKVPQSSTQVTKETKVKPSKNVGGAQDKPLTTPKIKITRSKRNSTKVTVTDAGVHATVEHHPTFKVTKTQGYNYTVEHKGVTISLNSHGRTMEYIGYKVRGVPDILPDVKRKPTPVLVEKLAMAHHQTSKGNAPKWEPDLHGSAPDPALVGQRKANPGVPHYGVMQIHHVDQWAKDPARLIEADLKGGKITPEQALERYIATVEKRPSIPSGKKAEDDEGDDEEGGAYQLKLRPQSEREFVILAGGMHQGGTPLYLANHPKFYDPDSDTMKPIGIPHVGEGSREWFDKDFRKPFWKEYAKVQVTELTRELDRRFKRGEVTREQIESLIEDAKTRIKKKEVEW